MLSNTETLCYKNNHNVKIWLESQVETFSMFGYDLNFLLPDGQGAIPDTSAPIPTGEDIEIAFNFWKRWHVHYCYKEYKGEHWWLYPIVDEEKAILWIAYTEPPYSSEYPIYSLADTYLEKFVW